MLDIKGYLRNAVLMDDDFMNICLNDNIPAVQAMLIHILGQKDLKITKVETQRELRGFGRSLKLDVWAENGKIAVYNEEFQNDSRGAIPRRARFHCGMIDMHCLDANQGFEALPESYVIFITRHDVFKHGKTAYTINRYIDGTDERFNDGQHIIYVKDAYPRTSGNGSLLQENRERRT